MPRYSVRVMALNTLDFDVEAADEMEALAKMEKILKSKYLVHNPSPDGYRLREIVEDFREYVFGEGPDILKLTGEAELID